MAYAIIWENGIPTTTPLVVRLWPARLSGRRGQQTQAGGDWRAKEKTVFPSSAVLEYAVGVPYGTQGLIYEILSVVEEIPEGCVATYGRLRG